jgi:hypothetical protein
MPKKIVRKKVPKRPLTKKQQNQQKLYEKFLKSKPGDRKTMIRKRKKK